MRGINRSAVLEYLRLARTASRTEMAERLQISLPSIARITDELIRSGLVRPTGEKQSGRGRGRELLEINSADNLVIAIDLGGSHISGALVRLDGGLLHDYHDNKVWGSGEKNFQVLTDFLQMIIAQSRQEGKHVLGIAIGVPALLDSQKGLVRVAPALAWKNFPLLDRLQKITDLPISIENDVNLAALGEHWFGAGQGVRDLVMIAIGTGIGAGIILDGKLYRGHSESSGEIGYMLPGIKYLDHRYPGFGALETVASGAGIARQAAKIWSDQNNGQKAPRMDAEQVFQAAREKQPWALQVVKETVDHLSLALANVIVCLDPELIVLGGGIAGSSGMLIEPIQKRLTGVIPRIPKIVGSTINSHAVILGGVVRVFQKYTDYSEVQSS